MAISVISNDPFHLKKLNQLLANRFAYVGVHFCKNLTDLENVISKNTIKVFIICDDILESKDQATYFDFIQSSTSNSKREIIAFSKSGINFQKYIITKCSFLFNEEEISKFYSTIMKSLSKHDQNKPEYLDGFTGDQLNSSPKAMHQQILDTMPMNIFWKDINSVIQGVNLQLLKLVGFDNPGDMIGKTDYDMPWTKEESDFYVEYDRRVMESGESELAILEPQQHLDGVTRWLETNKIPIKDENGKVVGILGAFLDATEKVKLQEENIKKEKLNVLAQIAGGVAHDINNSLAVIMGLAGIAINENKEAPLDQKFTENILRKIEKATMKANLVSKQLMAFTNEEHTFMSIVDMDEFLSSNIPMLELALYMKITVELNISSSIIVFDSSMLYQVFNNLIANAAQANPQMAKFEVKVKNIEIHQDHKSELPPGNYLQIECIDYAGGIKPSILENIFQPYFTTKSGGTGLGLASCKNILEMHDGQITVKSEERIGTTFTMLIPEATEEKVKKYIQFTKDLIKGEGTILYIEDNTSLAQINIDLMSAIGYTIEHFLCAEDLLENTKILESAFAIVTDFKLGAGKMNGLELLKKVRIHNQNLPVILLSSYIDEVGAIEKFDYGLEKPLNIQRLSQVFTRFNN